MRIGRRTPQRALVAVGAVTLLLASCGGSDDDATDDGAAANTTASSPRETAAPVEASVATTSQPTTPPETMTPDTSSPNTTQIDEIDENVALVQSAVDATLALNSFSLSSRAALEFGEPVAVSVEGSFDFGTPVGDYEIMVEQAGNDETIAMRSDGDRVWVRGDSTGVEEWVEGDADRLRESSTLHPAGLIGTVLTLRGVTAVEVGDTIELDGVTSREYRSRVHYPDAVEAAGADAAWLTRSLSLTGPAADSDLIIEVWIGDDGIIRQLHFDVDSALVAGQYDLEITGANAPIPNPEPPPADQTLSGPQAERILDQVIS